jgi:hypothetical protein
MKYFLTFILFACALIASPQKLIIGKWVEAPTPVVRSGSTTFDADGTFSGEAELAFQGKTIALRVKGDWRIEDSTLIEKITASSVPDLVPVGLVTKDKIVALTEGSLTLRSEKGKEHTKKKEK